MSITELKNKKVAVLGVGREGLSTLRFLKKNKIEAEVLDVKFDKKYAAQLKSYDVIFRTPGFPRLHPKLLSAEKKGAAVTSHIKLFFDLCPGKIIGITGTKGKTTTAFLIYNVLKSKYPKKTFIAGNFGRPALDILPKLKKNSLVVLELSSFQLQDLHKSPNVAVITNLTLDHMDPSGNFGPATHQTAKEYFEAKLNIIKEQKNGDFAVIHPSLKKITKGVGRGKKIYYSPASAQTRLLGKHNLENIAAAKTVGKIFRISGKALLKEVKNFRGVEHRLEFVAKVNGVSFYNDSAATNPDATLAALKSFKEPVHLILGGSDKGLDYKNLAKYIVKNKNMKSIALIGEIKNKLYKLLTSSKRLKIKKRALAKPRSEAKLLLLGFRSLKDAVLTVYKNTGKNEVVLLSPAAASFGMFRNYAHRGDEFKKLVKQLRRAR